MNIKRRVFEVWMSDNKTRVIVKAPSMEQFTNFLDSFGVIKRIGDAFQAVQTAASGGMDFSRVNIPQQDMDEFYPLLAVLSSYRELKEPLGQRDPAKLDDVDYVDDWKPVTPEDYKGLSIDDGMAIMFAYIQLLAPEKLPNPTSAEEQKATPPQEQPI